MSKIKIRFCEILKIRHREGIQFDKEAKELNYNQVQTYNYNMKRKEDCKSWEDITNNNILELKKEIEIKKIELELYIEHQKETFIEMPENFFEEMENMTEKNELNILNNLIDKAKEKNEELIKNVEKEERDFTIPEYDEFQNNNIYIEELKIEKRNILFNIEKEN
ncbi:hypothetical protein KJ870_07115 [bacterium]|nr:hypothetical protein [bacterium]MBU1434689.1 hypothetical protein [bacterium]MBU1502677.1 hypothetical protein [bacterium]